MPASGAHSSLDDNDNFDNHDAGNGDGDNDDGDGDEDVKEDLTPDLSKVLAS